MPVDEPVRAVDVDDTSVLDDCYPVAQPFGLLHQMSSQEDCLAALADATHQIPDRPPRLPVASKSRNRRRSVREIPAMGAATASSPMTNLETRSRFTPWRRNSSVILATHETGLREDPQTKCSVLLPHFSPPSYHARSAETKAATETETMPRRFNFPNPASAPAATRSRFAGTGKQACLPTTETKSSQ